MIDVNKEAEEYLKQWDWAEDVNGLGCFIAGHNSKSTQAKILQAQIDLLGIIYSDNKTSDFSNPTFQDVVYELEKLKKQLKELEDERNN
jgi:hypothetical protein